MCIRDRSYGADFSRGLRLADGNAVTLFVSGTASIDEQGRTVHVGDMTAQAERMLHNIAMLLAQQNATFADLVSGITYLKHAAAGSSATASVSHNSSGRQSGASTSAQGKPSNPRARSC